jgi:type VI secretion system protein ImpA
LFDPVQLAQAINTQSPCGPDCGYDGDFLALSQAVAGKPEQQFGDTIIAAVEPDWRSVEQMAIDLLARTKDLRVVAWLTQAATHLHGVAGFGGGVELMRLLCWQYWDEVHPRLVIDDEDDPYLRINALAELSDGTGGYSGGSEIMRALRTASMVNGALSITVRDVEMGALNDPAARYTDAQIMSILADAISAGSDTVKAFEQGIESISGLAALIGEKMSAGDQPDFSALKALTKTVATAISRARSSTIGEASDDAGMMPDGAGTAGSGDRAMQTNTGEIRSREDVRRALQRVCAFLERHEPSNPASLFARRAERMLDMKFLDIMRELAPDTMSHLHMLTGATPANE